MLGLDRRRKNRSIESTVLANESMCIGGCLINTMSNAVEIKGALIRGVGGYGSMPGHKDQSSVINECCKLAWCKAGTGRGEGFTEIYENLLTSIIFYLNTMRMYLLHKVKHKIVMSIIFDSES